MARIIILYGIDPDGSVWWDVLSKIGSIIGLFISYENSDQVPSNCFLRNWEIQCEKIFQARLYSANKTAKSIYKNTIFQPVLPLKHSGYKIGS